ncbi:MAG TPA: sugar phosphate isomerase/epimerase family protein [Tepidisphaeraceae bacterium]|jgi:sugar phosphate isomerase/epimerase|nr:sugar phosphate isomerase/epimerase family protein [Tepidisphaeraceae bacterium]
MSTNNNEALRLSGFTDEISPQLDDQISAAKELGLTHVELRGVYGKNVLDFDSALRTEIKTKLTAAGMGVISIGSPIGKVKISDSWDEHFERFKVAVDAAEFFGAPFIRVFSYYPADNESHADLVSRHKDEVVRRFKQKVEYIKERPVVMVHENEGKIYGEKGRECRILMQEVNSPKLRSAFDFANFVQAGEHPINNWPMLKEYTVHIHIKDALLAGGKVVPAGQGDGDIEPILRDAYASGYRGFLSLEPHLAAHGQFSGFSGPALFKTAVEALRTLAAKINVPLAGK